MTKNLNDRALSQYDKALTVPKMQPTTHHYIVCPILDLAGREDSVEDDSDEVNGGGDDKDVVPLHLDHLVGRVVLRDLLDNDGTNHATDCAHAVGDAHQDGGVPRRDILMTTNSFVKALKFIVFFIG